MFQVSLVFDLFYISLSWCDLICFHMNLNKHLRIFLQKLAKKGKFEVKESKIVFWNKKNVKKLQNNRNLWEKEPIPFRQVNLFVLERVLIRKCYSV